MKQLLPFLKFQLVGIVLLLFSAIETDAQNICVSGNSITPATTQNMCVGTSSTPLVAAITTSGSGAAGNITYNWYSNTTNSTSGGTLVQTNSTNTGTTSNSFTPPSTVSGTLWYYAVVTNDGGSCSGTSFTSLAIQVNVNALPKTFTVSGGGTRCSNGPGIGISLSGSETSVNYQLVKGGSSIGSQIKGTGHPITFVITSAGTYNIVGKSISGNCLTMMTGSATIVVNPAPGLTYTKTDVSCNGGDGSISVTGTGGAPGYMFSINSGGFSSSNTFTGLSSGTYTVAVQDANTCSSTTNVNIQNIPPVTVNIVSVNPGDCSGTAGSITASMSGGTNDGTTPLEYKLDGDISRPYQTSNVFGGLSKGNYTITIKDSKGCTGVSSTVTLTQVAGTAPTAFDVTGGGTRCSSSAGVSINLSGSETGVSYQLSMHGSPIGSSVSGTGSPIGFLVSDSGTYAIIATNTSAGCNNIMNGNATVVVNQSPNTFNVSGGGVRCSNSTGVSITLSGSQTAVNYQLLKGGSPVGSQIGGTGHPISFVISSPGTYTMIAKSTLGGCSTIMAGSATIGNQINPAITPSYTKEYASSCVGGDGTITVIGGGGTPGYLYSIDNKPFTSDGYFTALAAGDHKIVIKDANSCTFTYAGITVLTAPIMQVNGSPTKVSSCKGNDGSISGYYYGGVVDGITPLQYQLGGDSTIPFQTNSIFSGLAPGSYTVSIKDSKGCIAQSAPITLTVADTLAFKSTSYSTDVSSCGNGMDARIAIGVTGGVAPYHYLLNGIEKGQSANAFFSFENLGVGTYTVTVNDLHGCSISKDFTISQATAPVASIAYRGDETCIGANNGFISLSPTNIGGIPTYSYSKDGGTTYQSSYSFTNLAPATYSMVVKDSKGCTSATISVTIHAATKSCRVGTSNSLRTAGESNSSIPMVNVTLNVQAFPNPSSSEFTLNVSGNNKDKVSIIVTDILGRRYQQMEGTANQQFKLGRKLKEGVYIIQVTQGDKVQTIKVVKE